MDRLPEFQELYDSLPEQYHCEEVEKDLRWRYTEFKRWIDESVARAKQPSAYWGLFQETGGSQLLSEFSVSDLSIRSEPSFNWHLQDTSRWLCAGAIVFDKERKTFSSHT